MNLYSYAKKTVPHLLIVVICFVYASASTRKRRAPSGGRIAVVADERLSALRDTPALAGKLLLRLSRGRFVAVRAGKRSYDGVVFYHVNVSSRTDGWIQREALVSAAQPGDDERLLRLIKASDDFDRLARARIFLDTFTRSPFRPAVLLLFGESAEQAAAKLSREALRRLDREEINAGGAPLFSYFLNYNGLDRYNRQGVRFRFDSRQNSFHYNGASWREVIRRYPNSPEAMEARKRLASLEPAGELRLRSQAPVARNED